MQVVLALIVAACVVSPVLAADVASGRFESRGVAMQVKGGMAFRGTSLLDKKDVIVVPITNVVIDSVGLADYYDRRRAFERRIKDDKTGVVFLEFQPNGNYRGLSYYFASGNGCGYCAGGVESTVKLTNGRLVGTLKAIESDRRFDIGIDLPVVSDDHGTPLPVDGGDPGKAYVAYHAALVKRDAKALTPLLSASWREVMDRASKAGQAGAFMKELADEHPSKSMRIVKGHVNGKVAVLLVAGESATSKLTGEVMLRNEGGAWRVDDELSDVVMQ